MLPVFSQKHIDVYYLNTAWHAGTNLINIYKPFIMLRWHLLKQWEAHTVTVHEHLDLTLVLPKGDN